MNRRSTLITLLVILAAAIACPTARADEFWLREKAEAAEQQAEEQEIDVANDPDAIVGVLLREEGDRYVIRVVGGEVVIPAASVVKRVKTDLTVEDIEAQEKELAEQRAAKAQDERRARAVEASATREAAPAQEASVQPVVEPVFVPTIRVFDPVLGLVFDVPADQLAADPFVVLSPAQPEPVQDAALYRIDRRVRRIYRGNARLLR